MQFSIKNLNHTYARKVEALRDLSLEFQSNSVTALLGPNGAGKSTLFKILAGLIHPTSGRIEINGKLWDRDDAKPLGHIGFVFQDPTVDPMRSGLANLVYAARLQGLIHRDFASRIDELVDTFQMSAFIRRPVGSLSGGQRRRLEIARALIHRPGWLFLDEPSTGLDIDNRLRLSEHLHELAKSEECGVLWCTHIPDELRPEDNVVIMNRGNKVFAGSFDSLDQLMEGYHELVSTP
jgi:ABC-2 type transport system ATP-binding protein